MKIFIAALATESNTFSPIPTGLAGFTAQGYYRRDGSLGPPTHGNLALIEWRRLAEADGHTIIDSLCAFAQPAGTTLRAVYEDFREMILADLRAAAPVDLVLLKMHGAMVAYGYDDCEGDLIERVRILCTVYDPKTGKYRVDYRILIEVAGGVTFALAMLWFFLAEWWARRKARRAALFRPIAKNGVPG